MDARAGARAPGTDRDPSSSASDSFDRALGEFPELYADQNEHDYGSLQEPSRRAGRGPDGGLSGSTRRDRRLRRAVRVS